MGAGRLPGAEVQSDFAFSWLSVPFILMALMLVAMIALSVLVRGRPILRVSVAALGVASLPYAVGTAAMASCNSPEIAVWIARFAVGAVPFIGAAALMCLLTVNDSFEEHALWVGIAGGLAVLSFILCCTTHWVISDVWRTSWGLYYPVAGPLNELHVGQLVLWSILGVRLGAKNRQLSARQQLLSRRVAIVAALASVCVTDALLTHRIGVYPFSFLPACVAATVGILSVLKHDLFHSTGLDRRAAYQVFVVAGLGLLIFVVLLVADSALATKSPGWTVVMLLPLYIGAQLSVRKIRLHDSGEQSKAAGSDETAVDDFVEMCSRARGEEELCREFARLLSGTVGLSGGRLYVVDEEGVVRAADADSIGEEITGMTVDFRVRAWLIANQAPLVREDLPTIRLGGLREPIRDFMTALAADIVLPLVDRETLVGVAVTAAPNEERALRDYQLQVVRRSSLATARALTYIKLAREAEARVEVAREVEVAAAVQHARATGITRQQFSHCEVISYYQPASQFGGDWWTCSELSDGRLLVVIGEVSGHGVPAALVSFTVEGACATAQRMLGNNFEVLALMQLLNQTVRDVGGSDYAMSCFAAVFDFEENLVTFTNAGYPFPYLCREPDQKTRRPGAQLRALVSRGTPLGAQDPTLAVASMKLRRDDVAVFYSESIVESANPDGERFGDRRFQRLLRNKVRSSGKRCCDVVIDELQDFYQGEAIEDDLTLVLVRMGSMP